MRLIIQDFLTKFDGGDNIISVEARREYPFCYGGRIVIPVSGCAITLSAEPALLNVYPVTLSVCPVTLSAAKGLGSSHGMP